MLYISPPLKRAAAEAGEMHMRRLRNRGFCTSPGK